MKNRFAFCVMFFSTLLLSLLLGCSSSRTTSEDYENVKKKAYKEGYQSGYEDGIEETLDDLREEYRDGRFIYISDSTYQDLKFFVEEFNGFEYTPEEYIIEVWDYFDKNEDKMDEDEKEAFQNVITYFYDADWLTRRILSEAD